MLSARRQLAGVPRLDSRWASRSDTPASTPGAFARKVAVAWVLSGTLHAQAGDRATRGQILSLSKKLLPLPGKIKAAAMRGRRRLTLRVC